MDAKIFDGINHRSDHKYMLDEYAKFTKFEDLVFLEMGSDPSYAIAQAFLRLGAKDVYALNPAFTYRDHSCNSRLTLLHCLGELAPLPDQSVDRIFGMAIMEHISNPSAFARSCKRLLRPGGRLYLQGYPLWTCPVGHHTCVKSDNTGVYYHYTGSTNPYEPWEHLAYDTENEARAALIGKGIPVSDCELLAHNLFHSTSISRLAPSVLEQEYKAVFGDCCNFRWSTTSEKPNRYYELALEKYSADELNIRGVTLTYCKIQ